MSPRYQVGEVSFQRKHFTLPCVLAEDFDSLTPEEQAKVLKETWWADYITVAEWRALMREEGPSPSARSRLKRKATAWFMALGRIAALDPDLYEEVTSRARDLYLGQLGNQHPCFDPDDPDA